MEKDVQDFISLKDVYNEKPYCDYMKKMCKVRDDEISNGTQENSVMNMVLAILKKIDLIHVDVLKWLSEHYYTDWQIMKNILYFVNKGAGIEWFQIFEKNMAKWKDNYQYASMIFGEFRKAFDHDIGEEEVTYWLDQARNPHEFALMLKKRLEDPLPLPAIMAEGGNESSNTDEDEEQQEDSENEDKKKIAFLMESLEFYKDQYAVQQAEIDSLNKYKMQQEMLHLCQEGNSQESDYLNLIEQQNQRITDLEQENVQLKDKISEEKEKFQLEIRKLSKNLENREWNVNNSRDSGETITVPSPHKESSLLTKIRTNLQQKKFNALSNMKQREYILNQLIKNNISDLEYIRLLKKLIDSSKIELSFIFVLIKSWPTKEELKAILLLLDEGDVKQDANKNEVNRSTVRIEEERKTDILEDRDVMQNEISSDLEDFEAEDEEDEYFVDA